MGGKKALYFLGKKPRNDFEKCENIPYPSPGSKAKYGKVHIFACIVQD